MLAGSSECILMLLSSEPLTTSQSSVRFKDKNLPKFVGRGIAFHHGNIAAEAFVNVYIFTFIKPPQLD